MGADGLEPPTTVQTGKREKGVSNVILPEVELFKVQCFFKEPWSLICNDAANQPIHTKSSILRILHSADIVSKRVLPFLRF